MSLALIDMDAEYRLRGCIVLDGPDPSFAGVDDFWEVEIRDLLDPLPEAGWAFSLKKLDRDANWMVARRATIDWDGSAESLLAALKGELGSKPLDRDLDEVLLAIGR